MKVHSKQIPTVERIVETQGNCTICGLEAVLGNGYCVYCWDEIADSNSYRVTKKRRKKWARR